MSHRAADSLFTLALLCRLLYIAALWRVLPMRLFYASTTPARVVVLAMAAMIAYMTLLPAPIDYERFRVPIMPLVCALMSGALAPRAALAR